MRPLNDLVLSSADASADAVGPAILASFIVAASVIAVLTGAPVGTVKLQASNDAPLNGAAPTNWVDVPDATAAVSAAGVVIIPKLDTCYNYLRVVYSRTSGTGTVTARLKTLAF